MSVVTLLGLAFAALLLGAVASLAVSKTRRASGWVSVGFVAAAAFLLGVVVVRTFSVGPDPEVTLLNLPVLGCGLTVAVDHLSALFLGIVATIALLTTLFSVEYMKCFDRESVAKYYPLLLVLFAGIVGVVVSADFLFFLVFWELMTLASFFLVVFERENRASQRAGLKYFVVTHAATFGMVAAGLILWTRSGSFHFAALRDAMGETLATQPLLGHLVLLLFFLGFATKAGVLPMGSWLPDAYPAAPSGATAAFGGTMTKLGIYGLLRVFLHFLPPSGATEAWGFVIAAMGLASLFVGTLSALKQDDTKRLMSFHVIGQVGYMCLGVGMGLALLRSSPTLAALGLLGGVFHVVNHSLYKSCLFLGAGAVHYRTGTLSLQSLGGLGSLMPVTALCAGSAALAIAGVPPLNGFASKWLMYGTAILGGQRYALLPLAAVVAMFISLVTLASFLKYLGGAYLGPGATHQEAREVPATMLVPQVLLALLCVGFGLVPLLPLGYVHQAVVGLPSAGGLPGLGALLGGGVGMQGGGAGVGLAFWAPLPVALLLLALALLIHFGLQRAGGAAVRIVPVWTGGEEADPREIRYPAGSFYLPFKEAFRGVYPTLRTPVPPSAGPLRRMLDLDRWLYLPLVRGAQRAARGLSRTHTGVPQLYLLWIVLGVAAVTGCVLLLAY